MSGGTDRLTLSMSLYCDVLRFLAAFCVILGHAGWGNLSGGFLWQLQALGHPAVIVFFVLSGYIIAYVAATRETGLLNYSAARLARLYSVVIPAIVLTIILDTIGRAHNPSVYSVGDYTSPVWRVVSAALFLSQSWQGDVSLFSNSSYWSLPYEFWYYALFGAAMFLRGSARIGALVVSALIAGPGILLLFPIWLAGVAAYRVSQKLPSAKSARILWLASIAVIAVGHFVQTIGGIIFWLGDYIIGAGLALNLYAASAFKFAPLQKFKNVIRPAAGMTFSLYLFHLPIFLFVAAFLPPHMPSPLRYAILIGAALTGSAIFSRYTEARKDVLKKALITLFARRAHGALSHFAGK